jgi:hypothetical protein
MIEILEQRRLLSAVTVPLTGSVFNEKLSTVYTSPPSGKVTLGGEAFSLSGSSFDSSLPGAAAKATQACSVSAPQDVRILLNSNHTDLFYKGQTVGAVTLAFGNGATYSLPLVIGNNIREWRPTGGSVNTVTSTNSKKVFDGQATAAGGGPSPAIIDMLTVPVPTALRSRILVSVTLSDTLTAGSPNPGVVWMGLTVDGTPNNASISGRVYNDANGNGLRDVGEAGLGLWKLYIDKNNNGKLDSGETTTTTDINGNWSFKGLAAGTYVIRVVPVSGLTATKPTGGVLTIKVTVSQATSGYLFGERSNT